MFNVLFRKSGARTRHVDFAFVDPASLGLHRCFDALLHASDTLQVLVQFRAVFAAELPRQSASVFEHNVEDAGCVSLQRFGDLWIVQVQSRDGRRRGTASEQPIKGELRNDFIGQRRVSVSPSDVRTIDASESATHVVDAGVSRVDAEFQTWQRRLRTDL